MSSFDMEILEEKRNPLIDRVELKVKVDHFGKGTPNRLEIKKKVSALKTANEKLTILKKVENRFGASQNIVKIYIYDNAEEMKYYEPFYIQVRNLPKEKREEIYKLKKKNKSYKHLFEY